MRKHLIGGVILLGVLGAALLFGSLVNGLFDFVQIPTPSAPPSGQSRLYVNSTTHQLSCLNSDSSSCAPTGGGGGTFAGFTVQSGSNFYGPIFPLTIPTDPGTWVNQGGAMLSTNADGTLSFQFPGGNTLASHARVKAIPATPYTVQVAILENLNPNVNSGGSGFTACGLVLWDSSGTKNIYFVELLVSGAGTGYFVAAANWNDFAGSFSGNLVDNGLSPGLGSLLWLQIADDGTTRSYATSTDGVHFQTFYSNVDTAFLVPDRIGYVGNDGGGNAGYGCTILSSNF